MGPNSAKRILDAQISDPNSWVEFFGPIFSQEKRPPEKFTLEKFTSQNSGRKKEPKPKLFGPDIFQWGRGLPRERMGAKKFDTSLETREIKLFGRDIPGFGRDIPGARKVREKNICVQFPFPTNSPSKIGPENSHCTSAGQFG